MAISRSELSRITREQPSSEIVREAFHESLRDYVRAVLDCGQQSEKSETLVRFAFEAILQSGSVDDIAWAQCRLGRAISALDDGHYVTVQPHQSNFERMIHALGMLKTVRSSIESVWAR